MERFRAFLRRKNIVFSAKRYGVDALGAMAQGLFCTLLVGTILDTLGTSFTLASSRPRWSPWGRGRPQWATPLAAWPL